MGLAYPFSLIFEVPFVNLDKILLSPLSIKKDRTKEMLPNAYSASRNPVNEGGTESSNNKHSI